MELWARAFAATLVVEEAVATPLLAASGSTLARRLVLVLLANLASHPVIWLVLPQLAVAPAEAVALGEAWAVAVEALLYRTALPSLRASQAVAASALANAASLAVGLCLRCAMGWP